MGIRILRYATYPGTFYVYRETVYDQEIFYRSDCLGNHLTVLCCSDCLLRQNGYGCRTAYSGKSEACLHCHGQKILPGRHLWTSACSNHRCFNFHRRFPAVGSIQLLHSRSVQTFLQKECFRERDTDGWTYPRTAPLPDCFRYRKLQGKRCSGYHGYG